MEKLLLRSVFPVLVFETVPDVSSATPGAADRQRQTDAADFPENGISIFPDLWLDPAIGARWTLNSDPGHLPIPAAGITYPPASSGKAEANNIARNIRENRRLMKKFLDYDQGIQVVQNEVYYIRKNIYIREPALALGAIDAHHPGLPGVLLTTDIIANASTRENKVYYAIGADRKWDDELTLRGYIGTDITQVAISFQDYQQPSADRTSFTYYTNLWRAECHVLKGHFNEALPFYASALTFDRSKRPQGKMVALRQAKCLLAYADTLYRQNRNISLNKATVLSLYDQATRLLNDQEVDLSNPVRLEIDTHIAVQTAKLNANRNFLGTYDNVVPVMSVGLLEQLTDEGLTQLQDLANKYEAYRNAASHLADVEAELRNQIRIAQQEGEIRNAELQKAIDLVASAENKLAILKQRDVVVGFDWLAQGCDILLGAIQAYFMGSLGVLEVPGLVAKAVDLGVKIDEHDRQMAIIEYETDAVRWLEKAAELEVRKNAGSLTYFNNVLTTTSGRDLNEETYYALASHTQSVLASKLQSLVQLMYQYERSVAFKFGDDNKQYANFSRIDSIFDSVQILSASADMRSNEYDQIRARALPTEKADRFEYQISLATLFPQQFAKFRLDPFAPGEMYFLISLYDIERRFPGSYNQRIENIRIRPKGIYSSDYAGELTHFGTFLLRDRDATMHPETGTPERLLPTADAVRQALEVLKAGTKNQVITQGVSIYCVDSDTMILSRDSEEYRPVIDHKATGLMEGYGLAGMWKIRLTGQGIPENLVDIEIDFKLGCPEVDLQLQEKVIDLCRKYDEEIHNATNNERLDSVRVFSLRRYPSLGAAWTKLKQTGEVSFQVSTGMFPTQVKDLLVKSIILQAIDRDAKGVAGITLEYLKNNWEYLRRRTTRGDGYTDDVSQLPDVLPQSERFPVLGDWSIKTLNLNGTPDPSVLQGADDILFYVMYEYSDAA